MFIKLENRKITKDNLFFKMTMYLCNHVNMLRYKVPFFLKNINYQNCKSVPKSLSLCLSLFLSISISISLTHTFSDHFFSTLILLFSKIFSFAIFRCFPGIQGLLILSSRSFFSTLRREKYAWFYSKFNAELDELSHNFPNLQEMAQNLEKPNSS